LEVAVLTLSRVRALVIYYLYCQLRGQSSNAWMEQYNEELLRLVEEEKLNEEDVIFTSFNSAQVRRRRWERKGKG
jgi:hypothetical protein